MPITPKTEEQVKAEAEKNTPLPPECDRDKVSKLVSGAILKGIIYLTSEL